MSLRYGINDRRGAGGAGGAGATIPFPKIGVKVSYFRRFIRDHGGEDQFLEKTTTDINNLILKPKLLSANVNLSLCDYLSTSSEYSSYVGHNLS